MNAISRALWMHVVEEHLPAGARRILDVGCGTGRFARPMAERFGVSVIGVEPSRGMLEQAEPHAAFLRLRARAEALAVSERSIDLVFLSMVIHHIEDHTRFASELGRVLIPGGRVLIRNCFRGRMAQICFFRYCPAALRVENERMPSVEQIESAFSPAGLRRVALRTVLQTTDRNMREHCVRLQKRTMSTFRLMTEDEITDGLEAFRRAAEADTSGDPVIEGIDMLVFERV